MQPNQLTINILSGLCGSGKTTQNYNVINKSNHNRFVYVTPSINLSREVVSVLKRPTEVIRIDSDSLKGTCVNVVDAIYNALSSNHKNPNKVVIVITQQAYDMIDHTKFKNYTWFWDEMPTVSNTYKITFDNENVFEELFNLDPITNRISLTELTSNEDNHYGKTDNILKIISLLKRGTSDVYKVSEVKANDRERGSITFNSFINDKYFPDNITITSADMEDSLFVKYFTNRFNNIKFNITQLPTNNMNHDSSNITIYYGFERNNSKSLRINNPKQYNHIFNLISNAISVEGQYTMLLKNNSFNHNQSMQFVKINHNDYGLNEYSHIKNIMIQSATNYDPSSEKLTEIVTGADDFDLYVDRTIFKYYQIIMRSALRVNTPIDKCNIGVMSLKDALLLQSRYFPNAKIVKVKSDVKFVEDVKKETKLRPLTQEDRNKIKAIVKLAKSNKQSVDNPITDDERKNVLEYSMNRSTKRNILEMNVYKNWIKKGDKK